MEEVAAAARYASPPSLPTCALLSQLFPSAAGLSACVPSADGLGYACADLLLPSACGQQCAKLVEPLPCGGLLSFALAHPPAEMERQLMRAFAAELSDRLRPRGLAASKVRVVAGGELRSRAAGAGREGRRASSRGAACQQRHGGRCRQPGPDQGAA